MNKREFLQILSLSPFAFKLPTPKGFKYFKGKNFVAKVNAADEKTYKRAVGNWRLDIQEISFSDFTFFKHIYNKKLDALLYPWGEENKLWIYCS